MRITKGLIISDPWIDYILGGTKDWEMRSSATSHRGWFGLIRKGSGAVYGVAMLTDVGAPLSPTEMIGALAHHRIPEHMIRSGEVAKCNTPWKLASVRRLDRPIPYRHKSGAVTWVELDAAVSEKIADALRSECPDDSVVELLLKAEPVTEHRLSTAAQGRPGSKNPAAVSAGSAPASRIPSRLIGEIEINDANLRNDHFYLRPLIGQFPDDVLGGSNKATKAPREVLIDWGGSEPVRTDIDGQDKKFFRARGWIGAFFKLHGARPGDLVVIEETEPYRYRVSLRRRDSEGRGRD